jgi:hypothetical protein
MGYYLFAILPNIGIMLTVGITLAALITFIFFICGASTDSLDETEKYFKPAFYTMIILCLLQTFIPSQKQLAFIIAAPYIVENQQLQEAGKNSAEIIKLGTEYVKDVLTTSTTKKGE